MARADIPFVDIPATDELTVRLELIGRRGLLAICLYYGGDPGHTLGTDDVFIWHGRWVRRRALIDGLPVLIDGLPCASDEEIVEFMRQKLVWHNLSERMVDAFRDSGALLSVLRDAESHHLALTVMGT
jgi:hypothetical protein